MHGISHRLHQATLDVLSLENRLQKPSDGDEIHMELYLLPLSVLRKLSNNTQDRLCSFKDHHNYAGSVQSASMEGFGEEL